MAKQVLECTAWHFVHDYPPGCKGKPAFRITVTFICPEVGPEQRRIVECFCEEHEAGLLEYLSDEGDFVARLGECGGRIVRRKLQRL